MPQPSLSIAFRIAAAMVTRAQSARLLEVGGSRLDVRSGQGLEIPPGVPHQFMNESQSTVTFLVVSCPHAHGDRTNV